MESREQAGNLGNWSYKLQESMRSNGAVQGGGQTSKPSAECSREGDWEYFVEGESPSVSAVVARYLGCCEDLSLPANLGGYAVTRIAPQAFAGNRALCSVSMPDTVTTIGRRAFAECRKLESIAFSRSVRELDSSVISGCSALREILLPDDLEAVPARFAARTAVERVELPSKVREVGEGAFSATPLANIAVAQDNPYLSSDGVALFDKANGTLLRALVQVKSYDLPQSCKAVAPSAFKGMQSLRVLNLNEGLESIGSYAFFRSSVTSLACPSSLKNIGSYAFASTRLADLVFKDGLVDIGEQAFSKTQLEHVALPATLEHLGHKAFWQSQIDYDDPQSIDVGPGAALLVDKGSLYERRDDGLCLVEHLGSSSICETLPETVEVGDRAFEGNAAVESVFLNKGLKKIGDRAFASCKSLWRVVLPWTIASIGEEAFFSTKLNEVRIGPDVEHVGRNAFEYSGELRTARKTVLESLSVAPRNKRYYEKDGMLIERTDKGDRVLLYSGRFDKVVIPSSVVEIADMAFYNASLKTLDVPPALQSVSQRAFLGCDGLEEVHVVFPRAVDGFTEVSVPFPEHPRDRWDFSRALAMDSDGLFFDFEIYDAYAVHELDASRVVKMALARLLAPIKLSESARVNYESAVFRYLPQALVSFEGAGDARSLNALLGYASRTENVMNELLSLGKDAQDRSLREVAMRLTEEW